MTRLGDLLDFEHILKPLATINLPKSSTFFCNFCKGVKIYHFLVKSFFGNFYRHLAIFFWSHCSCAPLHQRNRKKPFVTLSKPVFGWCQEVKIPLNRWCEMMSPLKWELCDRLLCQLFKIKLFSRLRAPRCSVTSFAEKTFVSWSLKV